MQFSCWICSSGILLGVYRINMTMRVLPVMLFVVASGLASHAVPHHSDAGMDTDTVMILEGNVVGVRWRNPHVYVDLLVDSDGGEPVEWAFQMGSTNSLRRGGWNRETLSVGDRVFVRAHPWRDGRPYALVASPTNDNIDKVGGLGLEPRVTPSDEPSSSTTLAGKWRIDRSNLVVYPGGFDGYFNANLKLTNEGRSAQEDYVLFSSDNPELTCVGRPTPAAILQDGSYLIQIMIKEDEQTVTILNEFYDELRTIYMDGRDHPDISQRFAAGHSIGRWEGETLVVETTNFSNHRSPYQIGVPSGAQKHVVERYRLTGSGSRAIVDFVLDDPEYIAEPLSDTRELIYSPEIPLYPFECDTRSTSEFLPEQ